MPPNKGDDGELEWGTKSTVIGPFYYQVANLLTALELATTRVVRNEETECLSLKHCPFSVCGFLPKPPVKGAPKKASFVITALNAKD